MSSETLCAPFTIDAELVSALRKQVRLGRVGVATAEAAIRVWPHIELNRYDIRPLLQRIWSLRDNLTAYDATYLALAEALNCELVTADRHLASAAVTAARVRLVTS